MVSGVEINMISDISNIPESVKFLNISENFIDNDNIQLELYKRDNLQIISHNNNNNNNTNTNNCNYTPYHSYNNCYNYNRTYNHNTYQQ